MAHVLRVIWSHHLSTKPGNGFRHLSEFNYKSAENRRKVAKNRLFLLHIFYATAGIATWQFDNRHQHWCSTRMRVPAQMDRRGTAGRSAWLMVARLRAAREVPCSNRAAIFTKITAIRSFGHGLHIYCSVKVNSAFHPPRDSKWISTLWLQPTAMCNCSWEMTHGCILWVNVRPV